MIEEENIFHAGDGLYVQFDGYGLGLRVNDHRNPQVAYIDGGYALAAIVKFWEQKSGRKLEEFQ